MSERPMQFGMGIKAALEVELRDLGIQFREVGVLLALGIFMNLSFIPQLLPRFVVYLFDLLLLLFYGQQAFLPVLDGVVDCRDMDDYRKKKVQ